MTGLLHLFLLMQLGTADADRLYREGKYAEAAAAYRALVQSDPAAGDAWTGLGQSLLQLHNAEAIAALARAQQLKPGDPEVARALARSYLEAGNAGGAVAVLERLVEKNSSDTEAALLLGEAMYRSGYYERALQLLGPAAARNSGDSKSNAMYAVSLAKTGRTEQAEAALRRLLDRPPAEWDLDVALTYVELLADSGRLTAAFPYVDKTLQARPRDPIAHFWKARLLLQATRLDEAAGEAEQSVALAPGLPFARNLLVQIYRRQGRIADAQRQADWLREYNDRINGRGR